MNIIISPVGTSILTGDPEMRPLVNKYSNNKTAEGIKPDDLNKLNAHIDSIRQKLSEATILEAKGNSAELNSIISYYNNDLSHQSDFHYLIPSDTYLGKLVAGIIEDYLKEYFSSVSTLPIKGLQTRNVEDFNAALSDLAKEIISIAENKGNSKLIFNLTAGFKAIQGFLLTLGMYYADESIYIFESSEQLMRIPKLPVKLLPDDSIEENLEAIRRIANGLEVTPEQLNAIPETLLLKLGDMIALSGWGEILWNKAKLVIYEKRFYPLTSDKFAITDKFLKSVEALSRDRYKILNCRFDELIKYLETGQKHCLKSLSFHSIEGQTEFPGSTHEFYAWSDDGGKRVYCHYNEKNQLIIDVLGRHLK